MTFHTAVSNKVNARILLVVTKGFNIILFYPFSHLDLDIAVLSLSGLAPNLFNATGPFVAKKAFLIRKSP